MRNIGQLYRYTSKSHWSRMHLQEYQLLLCVEHSLVGKRHMVYATTNGNRVTLADCETMEADQ